MGRLIYSAISSLDGYVEDHDGNFEWASPDEELHRFVNDLERPVRTYLYGRRMYETMLYWETVDLAPDLPAVVSDFTAIWRAAEKIVYSRTLESVSSAGTRIERDFDAHAVRQLKVSSGHDLTIGGAGLAAEAITAGLVDELHLFVLPIVLGGGKNWLPSGVRLHLELLDTRRFARGAMYLRYRSRSLG
jgi:dihydrofolate reductase